MTYQSGENYLMNSMIIKTVNKIVREGAFTIFPEQFTTISPKAVVLQPANLPLIFLLL